MHKHPEHRDPSPNAWLGRVNVLLAWAAKARQESEEAKRRSDERRRVLSGAMELWRRKRGEWLSRGGPGTRR